MNLNKAHTLDLEEFNSIIDKIKSLDDIVIISKNLNIDNNNIFEEIIKVHNEKENYIMKLDELYKKKEIMSINKKFEIKKNKEINIDVYYNMADGEKNIIDLSAVEFKTIVEKGSTENENKKFLDLINTNINLCEKEINDLTSKIIEMSNEKDEKWKKWSYLYENYRKIIESTDNKLDNIINPINEKEISSVKTIKNKEKNKINEVALEHIDKNELLKENIIVSEEKILLADKVNKKIKKQPNVEEIKESSESLKDTIKVKRNYKKKVLVSNINEVKKDNIDNEVDEVKVDEVKVDEVKNSKKITKKK